MAQVKDEYDWPQIRDALQPAALSPGAAGPEAGEEVDIGSSPSFSILKKALILLCAVLALAALSMIALNWWVNARHFETTDDAFIDTHIVYVSPQIGGLVTAVRINDNQRVHKGQILVEIDSADAKARLNQILAAKTQAESQYQQALDTEKAVIAQADKAARDLARYRLLQRTLPAAVSQQQIDQAAAADTTAAAQRDAAQQQVDGATAQVDNYSAQLAAAQLSVGYTKILSPIDGHIAQRSIAAGDYASVGQQMLAIIPLRLWVTANFKETQIADIRVGQKVAINADACGSQNLTGHIESIQRGAGQAFQVLPPENATGNYVKVVQRVPVKIALDAIPADCPLGPGMSVVPHVKVR